MGGVGCLQVFVDALGVFRKAVDAAQQDSSGSAVPEIGSPPAAECGMASSYSPIKGGYGRERLCEDLKMSN